MFENANFGIEFGKRMCGLEMCLASRSWVLRLVPPFSFPILKKKKKKKVVSLAKPTSCIIVENGRFYLMKEGLTSKLGSSKLGTCQGRTFFYIGLPNSILMVFLNVCGLPYIPLKKS